MKRLLGVEICLCSLLVIILIPSIEQPVPQSTIITYETTTCDKKLRTRLNRPVEQSIVSNYPILTHSTFEDQQEQIRDEIFYGDLELLAQLIQAEAGNQDLIGKRLVADVVLNRVDGGFENNIEMVIYQSNQFTSIYDGNFDEAAYNMTESDYLAAYTEMTGERIDYGIIYFSTEGYSKYGTPAYKYGDHYFSTR